MDPGDEAGHGGLGRLSPRHSGHWTCRDSSGWHKGHPGRDQVDPLTVVRGASPMSVPFREETRYDNGSLG